MKLVVMSLGLPALVLGLAATALAQSFSVFDAPNASYTYSFASTPVGTSRDTSVTRARAKIAALCGTGMGISPLSTPPTR